MGVQRGGLGGPAEAARAWVLCGRLHRPGQGLPCPAAGWSARALSGRPRLVRPFPGLPAPPPRLRAVCRPRGCTRAARGRPPPALVPQGAQGTDKPRRAEPRRCTRGARTGGRRLPRGQPEVRAAPEAAGLFSSFPYFIKQRSRNGECGVLWANGGRRGFGAAPGWSP